MIKEIAKLFELHQFVEPEGDGPYRDRQFVVVTPRSNMPRRCMVCNADIESLSERSMSLPTRGPARGIVTGTIAIAQMLDAPRILVRCGKCPKCKTWLTVTVVAFTSAAFSILGVVAAIYVLLESREPRFPAAAIVLFAVAGISLIVTCVAVSNRPHVFVSTGKVSWIKGFGRAYREGLPPLRKKDSDDH